jgi:hypothetical protein
MQSYTEKTVWCWHKNRYNDEQNRIDDLNKSPYTDSHLIMTRQPETCVEENSHFNKGC